MPEYHAWTHRPKAQGGTDPIELPEGSEKPFAYIGYMNGGTVTTGAWYTPATWDEGYVNNAGLVIQAGETEPLLDVADLDGDIDIHHGNVGPYGKYHAHAVWVLASSSFTGFLGVRISVGGAAIPLLATSEHFQDAPMTLNNGSQVVTHSADFVLVDDLNQIGMGVWHNRGSNVTMDSMILYVTQDQSDLIDGTFYP